MKIRMLEHRTGPRYDGRDWPQRLGEIDVPDDEGRALVAQGAAEVVREAKAPAEDKPARAAPRQK